MKIIFKITGAIFIMLSCTYFGFSAAIKLRQREKSLLEFEGYIRELKNRIIYDGSEVSYLLSVIFPPDMLTFSNKGIDITDNRLNAEDKRILEEYFLKLGTTESESEADRAALCIEQLKVQQKKAAEDCRQKSNLYRTLGLCCGIFGSIILI